MKNLEITGVEWRNSPFWTLDLKDVDNVHAHDFEINVDVVRQAPSQSKGYEQYTFMEHVFNMLIASLEYELRDTFPLRNVIGPQPAYHLGINLPTFPLNTDGIDPWGSNVLIENVKVRNFDDAIAVKPCNKQICWVAEDSCSQDVQVHNVSVFFSVGAATGSVPPSKHHNCVRRVNFTGVHFEYPIKSVYVKTNPCTNETEGGEPCGDKISAEIVDITYEDISIHFPMWWAVYIGQ